MKIVGINSFHGDSSACVVVDGQLVSAAEEERFRRLKHWAGFPSEALHSCLSQAGLKLRDIDHIALNFANRAHLARKILYVLRTRPRPDILLERIRTRSARSSIPTLLENNFAGDKFVGTIHHLEHHIAHLYSAFFVSPFESAVVVSIDAMGDFSSTAWGVGHGANLTLDREIFFPHSLGIFYTAITQYLGFPHYGDEYKVMGLAAYGKTSYLKQMREIVRLGNNGTFALNLSFFRHHKERAAFQWSEGIPVISDQFGPALEELLGPRRVAHEPIEERHRDLACSAQAMYEEAFFHLLLFLHAKYHLPDITLAGGCAMNSVANGKIRRITPFRRVYVQPAAGDAGGAIGAAFAIWHQQGGDRSFVMDHAYWGPAYSDDYIGDLIARRSSEIELAGCHVDRVGQEKLCERAARAIAAGKIVGWFQGRMEWGPRALGNRSILCDPREIDMKTILNAKIKRRESFRPFAPSILEEAVDDWFEENDSVPFMMQVFQIKADKRPLIPAVTHVDGSGRLQTVHRHTNPLFYKLIDSFRSITGVPMVLNTSFNENEPIVCRAQEALDCFFRTKMDVIVLGEWFIERKEAIPSRPSTS
jgi:carbamoyltransferase